MKHSRKEYLMFAEAWFYLAISRARIFFTPFRQLLPVLGTAIDAETAETESQKITGDAEFLKSVKIAILRACPRSPWRTMCFEQALAARFMLKRRQMKSVVYFGLQKTDDPKKALIAHAWIICSGITVTGGRNNQNFTVVGRFLI